MRLPSAEEWLFSFKAFAAAMLTLFIAFSLDLQRPYWAMLTAYIVAQPYAGMTRSKAVYRFIGTFVGAAMMVALVPAFVNAPELLALVLALWICGCVYLGTLEDPPRNYAFLLSGYTTALIGFPSVEAPGDVFMTAVARVEEISLGIVCSWVVTELVFPRAIAPQLRAGLDKWINAAATCAAHVLRGRETEAVADHRRLAAEAASLAALQVHAVYEEPHYGAAHALLNRMRVLLPIIDRLRDRLPVLRAAGLAPESDLAALADSFESRRPAMMEAAEVEPGPEHVLRAGTRALLVELANTWRDCLALRQEIDTGIRAARPALRDGGHDHGLAALAALSAAITLLITCGFWIATGWSGGTAMPMMAVVGCAIFAAMDDPSKSIIGFLTWMTLGSLVSGVWLFAIMPAIDGFPLLVFVLGLFLLPAGIMVAKPAVSGLGTAFIFGFGGSLALQSVYAADMPSWAEGTVAQTLGLWVAAAVSRVVRSVGTEVAVRRMLRAGRMDLARIAAGVVAPEPAEFAARMLRRIGAIAPRLTATRAGAAGESDAVAELRAGINIIALRRLRPSLPRRARVVVDLVLATLARHFAAEPAPGLRRRIDRAVRILQRSGPGPALEAAVALDGVRRAVLAEEKAA